MPRTVRFRHLAPLLAAAVLVSALGSRAADASAAQDLVPATTAGTASRVASTTARTYADRVARAAARRATPRRGHRAAVRARRHLPRYWRLATTVSSVRHRRLSVTVHRVHRCVTWPRSGHAVVSRHACRARAAATGARSGTAFGFFPGNESSDPTAAYSVKSSFTTISASLGTPGVARVFFPGLPPSNFVGSNADLGVPVVVSFKADPAGIAAGSYDAQILSFLNSIPADRTVWWSYYHEPEDNIERGEFTAAQYRAAWTHLEQIAPIRSTLRPTLILMRWSLQVSTRHIADYVTPGLKVLAWDAYIQQWSPTATIAFDPAKQVSSSFGLGFAIAETSIDNNMTTPPDRSTAVNDIVTHATTDNAEFLTWFETNKSDGDWRLVPYTAAAALWRQSIS